MNLSFIKDAAKRLGRITVKHAPEILAGLGIAGGITSTVLAVKATPEAMELIEEKKKELGTDELTVVQTVKCAWKPYIPAVVTGLGSVGCVLESVSTSLRRNAALTTMYEISRTYIDNMKSATREVVGQKKEQEIIRETNRKMVNSTPELDPVENPRPSGKQEFMFSTSQTRFWSTISKVKEDLADLMAQQQNSSEQYLGVVDALAYLGAFEDKSRYERDMIIDTWEGSGWSAFHQQQFVKFTLGKAILDEKTGRYVGVIDADIWPMDDYWSFNPK